MKYLEQDLIDPENEKLLEIESENLYNIDFAKIITEAFEKNGYTKANGSGKINYYWGLDFSFKYGFRDYIKFAIKDKNNMNHRDVNRSKFSKEIFITLRTSSYFRPKQPTKPIYRNTLTIDFEKLPEKIKQIKENKIENNKNKNVSKFKKDLFVPWFVGNIQDVVEDFEKAYVGYRHVICGNYSIKNTNFTIHSNEMTKKQFSEIEFEDIKFSINANISGTRINNQNLTMVGLKTILGDIEKIKKFISEETKKNESIIKKCDDEIKELLKKKDEINELIGRQKEIKENIKQELKLKIAKFANAEVDDEDQNEEDCDDEDDWEE